MGGGLRGGYGQGGGGVALALRRQADGSGGAIKAHQKCSLKWSIEL